MSMDYKELIEHLKNLSRLQANSLIDSVLLSACDEAATAIENLLAEKEVA